jgi:signal peptidase I
MANIAAALHRHCPRVHEHPIFKMTAHGEFDTYPDVVVAQPSLRHGRQSRQFRRQPRAVRASGVGLFPVEDLVGRVDAIVGSWDLAVKSRPIQDWPSGLRLSRFFTPVH